MLAVRLQYFVVRVVAFTSSQRPLSSFCLGACNLMPRTLGPPIGSLYKPSSSLFPSRPPVERISSSSAVPLTNCCPHTSLQSTCPSTYPSCVYLGTFPASFFSYDPRISWQDAVHQVTIPSCSGKSVIWIQMTEFPTDGGQGTFENRHGEQPKSRKLKQVFIERSVKCSCCLVVMVGESTVSCVAFSG